MALIIDGKGLALERREKIALDVAALKGKGVAPGLAVVLVGRDPASEVYVRNKRAACQKAGIASFDHDLPAAASEAEVLSLLATLNADPAVHGILVQLPLPPHISQSRVLCAIDPAKDVDGFHPCNVGRFSLGEPCLKPCTPAAVMELIDASGMNPAGKNAVVIGRSNIVGKPAALLLLERNATVTICHSATADLPAAIALADIVVAAVGRPALVRGAWIKPGAVVIDVGINRLANGKLAGDVEFDEAAKRASAITPVPGGVGPMTIAMLLANTVDAAKNLYPHGCDRSLIK
ncbi:MAG: bifunctional methylenetetrahydrofolate dehydrogenase/methenyltetrahydrofolate cyclohydrolase FolD [Pseudomonadota bacterium]